MGKASHGGHGGHGGGSGPVDENSSVNTLLRRDFREALARKARCSLCLSSTARHADPPPWPPRPPCDAFFFWACFSHETPGFHCCLSSTAQHAASPSVASVTSVRCFLLLRVFSHETPAVHCCLFFFYACSRSSRPGVHLRALTRRTFRDRVAGRVPGSRPICLAGLTPNRLRQWLPDS
jgi:hypothetical protein